MTDPLTPEGVIDALSEGIEQQPPWVKAQLQRLVRNAERIGNRPKNSHLTADGLQFHLKALLNARAEYLDWGRDIAGLFDDLAAAGFQIDELSDLTRRELGNEEAVTILMDWLRRTQSPMVRSTILTELSSKWAARYAIGPLIELFHQIDPKTDPDPNSFRWFIADVFRQSATVSWIAELLDIAKDPANGDARLQAIEALGKFSARKSELTPTMLRFLNSDEVILFLPAAGALGRWNVAEARPRIEQLIEAASTRCADEAQAEWETDELRKALWKIIPSGIAVRSD